MKLRCLLILLLGTISFGTQAQGAGSIMAVQRQDTIRIATPKHSVRTATLLSAFLPGAGQIYNRKYWKTPIVYAGLGTVGYLAVRNGILFSQYNEALRVRLDKDPNTVDTRYPQLLDQTVFSYREQYRRFRDLSFIGIAAIWAIQVVDAHVDAHLYGINFDDTVYLHAEPSLIPLNQGFGAGLGLRLRF